MCPPLIDLVPEYLLGGLSAEERHRFEGALASSEELRREVREVQEALALGAASVPALQPPPHVRRRILASLDRAAERTGDRVAARSFHAGERFFGFVTEIARALALPLDAVRKMLESIDGDGVANPFRPILPGVSMAHVMVGAPLAERGGEAAVLRLRPGARFPEHHHVGDEWALVLAGTGHDAGQIYETGSIIRYRSGTSHDFHAGDADELVLLVVHHGVKFH